MSLRAYASLAGRILATRWGGDRPFKITLSLTDRCDCRCRGCFIWARDKRPEPTPAQIGGLLESVPSIRWVNLTGGEIFLRDDVVEIARAVLQARPRLAVLDFPTTGQQPARIADDVAQIARLGVPRLLVTLSVEGPPPYHDEVRGRDGAFDRVCETLSRLRRIDGVHAYLGLTLTAANAHQVPATLAAVRRRQSSGEDPVGWRDVHLNVYTRSPHYYGNENAKVHAPHPFDGAPWTQALRARRGSPSPIDTIEATYLRLLPAYLATGRSPLPCQSLAASVFVATNGDVHPCTVWDRPLGNAYETPLAQILASEGARETRQRIAKDRCPGCWSPCEAHPTIVATAPESLLRGPGREGRRSGRT